MLMTGFFRNSWRHGWAPRTPIAHDRRRQPRYAVPHLTLIVGPNQFTTLDWSLTGGRIKQPEASLGFKDRLDGKLYLEGDPHPGGFIAEVARLTAAGDVGLRWLDLSGPIARAMA
jgi:hypothetical protein